MIKSTGVITLIGLLAAGTAAADPRQAFTQIDGIWQRSPHGCGTPQRRVLADPFALPPAPAVGLRTVFLNRNGGTYTVGTSTDASAGRVWNQIVEGNVSQFTIPPLNTSVFNWPAISACVRQHFQRVNVNFVETRPSGGSYIEALVGGTGQELGFGPNVLYGIASADNFCNVTERGIAFNFSETHRNVPRRDDELCATIAHEVGHLLALEHEQLPTDIMSYVLIDESGTKAFVDQTSGCGTSPMAPSGCYCPLGAPASNTNSYMRLATFIGLRDLETIPPTLDIDAPGGAVVPPTFDVIATATDNALMGDVIVLIDDVEMGNDLVPENNVYQVTVHKVAEGPHQLAVIARDAAGNMTRKDLAITVKKLATGEDCTVSENCAGDICATSPDGQFCTQACELDNDTCPEDFVCETAGAGTVCVPSPGGCGCSSSRRPGPMLLLALGVGALLLCRRRRR